MTTQAPGSDPKIIIVLSVISDLILAALPAIFLRNLQIGLRTKVGLCLLMGLGVLYVYFHGINTSHR